MAGLETDTQGRLLSRVVDAIIPGDELFPAASRVGVQEKLLERGFKTLGPDFSTELGEALALSETASDAEIVAALSAWEARDPASFEEMLTIVYLSYYEALPVKAAIRALGHDYHDTPQPGGYAMSPFDPANPLENPRHRRGRYVPTEAVKPVDWAALGDLGKRVG
jgi:hypothetical protein